MRSVSMKVKGQGTAKIHMTSGWGANRNNPWRKPAQKVVILSGYFALWYLWEVDSGEKETTLFGFL